MLLALFIVTALYDIDRCYTERSLNIGLQQQNHLPDLIRTLSSSSARYGDNAILKTGSYETPCTRRASDTLITWPILRASRSKTNELSRQFAYIIQNEIARCRETAGRILFFWLDVPLISR